MSVPDLMVPALALGLVGLLPVEPADGAVREWTSPPFVFHFPEALRRDIRQLETRGHRVLPGMAEEIGATLPERIDVHLVPVPSGPHGGSGAPDWAAGYVPGGTTTIVIVRSRLGSYPSWEIEGVFVHELTHVLIQATLRERAREIPRWFGEGLAMLQSRRWGFRDAYTLSSSLLGGTDLPLERIAGRFPERHRAAQAAYAESFSFMGHLVRKYGRETPRRILARVRSGSDFPTAFRDVTGNRLAAVEEAWRQSLVWKYRWIPILTANGTLFSGILLLFLFSYARKRRQNRRKLEMWDRHEPPDLF